MNNKGFTLIEIIGAILILSILMGIGIPLVTRYIKTAKNRAYETLEDSAYDAAQSYVIENGIHLSNSDSLELQINDLLAGNYIKSFQDPDVTEAINCGGKIIITRDNNLTNQLDNYKYEIRLDCSNYKCTSDCVVYPK